MLAGEVVGLVLALGAIFVGIVRAPGAGPKVTTWVQMYRSPHAVM